MNNRFGEIKEGYQYRTDDNCIWLERLNEQLEPSEDYVLVEAEKYGELVKNGIINNKWWIKDNPVNNELKYSITGDVYWIETELGSFFYDKNTKSLTFPSIILSKSDLAFIIEELRKVELLIKGIN